MKSRINHSGKIINNVKLLEHVDYNCGAQVYKCQYSCGHIKNVRIDFIRRYKKNYCPECMIKTGSNHYAWKGCGAVPMHYFTVTKTSAKQRNISFNVTIEYISDLYNKQNGKCALSGMPIVFASTYKERFSQTASLDRIDSSKGYIEGNLQWVHVDINYMKSNLSEEYLFKICKNIVEYRKL